MAPFDWAKLIALNVNDLEEDPTQAEDIYDELGEFEPGGEEDAVRLRKLFEVTQAMMLIKGTQASVAEEELAQSAVSQGKFSAKRDQELEDLRREVSHLKKQNKDLERFGGEAGGSGGGGVLRETRFLREELNEMEHQITLLQKDLKDKERQLVEERQISERYIARAEDAEKELREVKRDNDNVHEEIRDCQRQIESQRESIITKHDDDAEYRDRITQKNRVLNTALDDNKNLMFENDSLHAKIEELKQELKDGKKEIDKTTDDYLKLKLVVEQSDKMVAELQRAKLVAKHQVDDLVDQVRTKGDADDEIMVQVNKKVEEWKDVLADKDNRILELQQQMMKCRAQILAVNMDTEKTSVAVLSKALEERNEQIAKLRERLRDVTGDMDANTALIEDVRQELNRDSRGRDPKQQKIDTLQTTLHVNEANLKEAVTQAAEAESDAREKDKHLSEALERMGQYEAGLYGLPEAVAEIKELKVKNSQKDRQIEELAQYINKCELKVNDLFDEVEDLRERLGLDPKQPIDLGEVRKKKGIRTHEERALNQVLQKEVERLEEERISLKQHVRKLAKAASHRAGGTAFVNDGLLEDFEESQYHLGAAGDMKTRVEKEDLKIRNLHLEKECETSRRELERLGEREAERSAKLEAVERENGQLEAALKQIHTALKEHDGGNDETILECPILEQMLAAMETRSVAGRYDTLLYMKAQVANLQGHNDELRSVLREVRVEATKAKIELDKASTKATKLGDEVKTLKEAGAGAFFKTMALPEGMSLTSSDVIASLNEHLIQSLQELALKEDMMKKMEDAMESSRRKFAVMRHQQGLLYQDYMTERQQWDLAREKLEEAVKKVEGLRSEDQVRLQEFDRMLGTLAEGEGEVGRSVADMSRKMTVLRVNEKALTRRYTSLQDGEALLRKEIQTMKTEMVAMETAVAERIGYLQRYKDMAAFKMAALQKALDDSVPAYDLDKANKEFTTLTEKYRDLLEKSNSLVARTEQTSGFEMEMQRLQEENNAMRKELSIEKERLHTLEVAFDRMKAQGLATAGELRGSEVMSISKKLTTLEMKELNERQRAEHADRMYTAQSAQLRQLEQRNAELEEKFSKITRMNLEAQTVERDLRDELAECVTKAVSDADRKKISVLEKNQADLKHEVSKLKDITEVATCQVRALERNGAGREREVTSLRQQLVDLQAESDEKTVIGKLHRQVVALQAGEGVALRRLEDTTRRAARLDSHLLRTEQRLDEKNETIYFGRLEARNRVKHLKCTVQDLRRKYAGAVPLPAQEKFCQTLIQIQRDKETSNKQLKEMNNERLAIEDKLLEVQLQHEGLHDLVATLKDGKGAQKVTEWHGKMEALRLDELRHQREIARLQQQMKFGEILTKKHEMDVMSLEEGKVHIEKDFEARELEWDQRELELERTIASLEQQQHEIAGAASQFEAAVGCLPDTSWPICQQLEHSVTTIRKNIKMILDAKGQAEIAKHRIAELEKQLQEARNDLLRREKVITQLRLRMPATADRDRLVASVSASVYSAPPGGEPVRDYEGEHALKVAHSTLASLQQRLSQKEASVARYQQLLESASAAAVDAAGHHQEELRAMQQRLHNRSDAAFNSFKQTMRENVNRDQHNVPTNEQLKRLSQLEDVVAEQDASLSALRDKLTWARTAAQDARLAQQQAAQHHDKLTQQALQGSDRELAELRDERLQLTHAVADLHQQVATLQQELTEQREANERAPSSAMKKLVERLRHQVALKEKQHSALSQALLELRADMVTQAQDDVKANALQTAASNNVQRVVDRRTHEIQERLEEMESQNMKLKKATKCLRERETSLNSELEENTAELTKKEGQVRKLKDDKCRLETEVETLERKVERMGAMQKQKGAAPGLQQELDELRRKHRMIQEELKRTRHPAEKPYEQVVTATVGKETAVTNEASVERWEETKRWQKTVERLKGRLRDRDADNEKLLKANELAKGIIDKTNKDKESLEGKLRSALRVGGPQPPASANQNAWGVGRQTSSEALHNVAELRKRNYDLEEKLSATRLHEAALEQLEQKNKLLAQQLEQFALTESSALTPDAERSAVMERRLHQEVLRLSEENLELRFEVEQSRRELPRCKERIHDLEKYVEVLKQEKEQLTSGSQSSLNSPNSNVRRIGESGRSARELEKTIALLKKVVERSQAETKQLKQSHGYVSAEQLTVLQGDNQQLKSDLLELRQKMGASLSERYVSQQKGTARVMVEHDRLRRDLQKEMESSEAVRIELAKRDAQLERLQRHLAESRDRLQIEGVKRQAGSEGGHGWRSAVVTRMYEGKLKAFEEELAKKNSALQDVKAQLKGSLTLTDQKRRLVSSDSDVTRESEIYRLTVDRLENEKRKLSEELDKLRSQRPPGGATGSNEEELVGENVELRRLVETSNTERRDMLLQIEKLKQELQNFGPEFFDEIEDLKYNYGEAVRKNVEYEQQLSLFRKQFGVVVNLPNSP